MNMLNSLGLYGNNLALLPKLLSTQKKPGNPRIIQARQQGVSYFSATI
jgi:hypothetical protein